MPHFDWLALTVCGESLIQFLWCMSGVIFWGGIWLWGIQINSRNYWTGRQLCTKPHGIQHIRQWVASLALRTRGLRSLKLFDGLGNQSPSRGSPSDSSALIYHISPTTRAPAFQFCLVFYALPLFAFLFWQNGTVQYGAWKNDRSWQESHQSYKWTRFYGHTKPRS